MPSPPPPPEAAPPAAPAGEAAAAAAISSPAAAGAAAAAAHTAAGSTRSRSRRPRRRSTTTLRGRTVQPSRVAEGAVALPASPGGPCAAAGAAAFREGEREASIALHHPLDLAATLSRKEQVHRWRASGRWITHGRLSSLRGTHELLLRDLRHAVLPSGGLTVRQGGASMTQDTSAAGDPSQQASRCHE